MHAGNARCRKEACDVVLVGMCSMCPIGVSVAMKQETVELVDTVVRFHVILCTWSPFVSWRNILQHAHILGQPCVDSLLSRVVPQGCTAGLLGKVVRQVTYLWIPTAYGSGKIQKWLSANRRK